MYFRKVCLIALLSVAFSSNGASNQSLPDFGDASSGIVSLPQEHEIGQAFLRQIRSQVPALEDPILQEYLELLLYRLAANSQVQDRRLYPVLIQSPMINAFAAPGGIVGVNHGLFLHGETQHEMSAILAHELAHLSQRHFARGIEAGRQAGVITMAGLLAGIVLMTTVGSDAGLAAMSAGQGAAQSQQLSYSRSRESEADRVGIDTLARSGMDPRAMAYMFEQLERQSRYSGDQIPEFLRTHPVTKSRIADSYNQTQQFPKKQFPLDLDYQLMRARARAVTSDNPTAAIAYFKAGLNESDPVLRKANQYGLVLSLTSHTEIDEAQRYLRSLLENDPDKIIFRIAEAEIHKEAFRFEQALAILKEALELSPGNYPLTMAYAETLMKAGRPAAASDSLFSLTTTREDDELVWYLLAEAYGLANNTIGVHQARAEYFLLNGNFDRAIKQLGYALPLTRSNFQQHARIKQRIEEIWELRSKTG